MVDTGERQRETPLVTYVLLMKAYLLIVSITDLKVILDVSV